jgi:hypothetical protein
MKLHLLWLPLALAACSTMGGMRTEPLDAGAMRRYRADLETAVTATRHALVGSALDVDDVEQVDDNTWMFLAKRNTSEWSHGELIRVIVQQTNPDIVAVRVLSKRRVALEFTARSDWSDAVFAQLALDLNEVR